MTKPLGAVDFETNAIEARPHYPPKPVGIALQSEKWKKGIYLAFGHPTENNCTEAEARRKTKEFFAEHRVVCHHAGFDLDVAETHWGIKWPAEHEDTMILNFLADPDSPTLSLKPTAERYLKEPPTEQDKLKDWVLANVKGSSDKRGSEKYWAKYICLAPAGLVGRYAIGDVKRTIGLHRFHAKDILTDARLKTAYERALDVTRVLIKMERRGVPVAVKRLRADIRKYDLMLAQIEDALWKKMKVPKSERIRKEDDEDDGFSWSGPNFAKRLVACGLVKELPLTEKGNPSTSADSLKTVMPANLAHEFEVRSQIATCLNTFMKPWLAMAEETDGLFFARFNQVRDNEGGFGARTGRLSMTPNLQNIIRSDKDERVPKLRDYIATSGHYAALIERDFSQQELRLLAHYEDGPFLRSYMENPERDGHLLVRDLIRETTGIELDRRPVKDLNFGLIYGQGLALTAEKLGVPRDEAKRLRQAHADSLPGLPELQDDLKERARKKEPIWTWGGRRHYCEKPKFVKGRWWTFEYKLLNKLIQGSAADVTQQAMVNYDSLGAFAEENPMLMQIHDSFLNGVRDKRKIAEVHRKLNECMLDVKGITVPMLSDGKSSTTTWHRMKKHKDVK